MSRLAPYMLSDRVLLDGLQPDFEARLYGLLTDPRLQHRVHIVSGFRTYAQQLDLYTRWKAGTYDVPSVARPGTSRHETGRAADLGIGWGAPFGWDHVHAVSVDYGLHYPVRGEAWHVETKPGAPSVEEDMTPEQAAQLNDLHFALIGARRFSGDQRQHDLATPILSTNYSVQSALTVNGNPVNNPGRFDELEAAMPRGLDLEQLAAAIIARLPQSGSVVAGPSLEQVKEAVRTVLREGVG